MIDLGTVSTAAPNAGNYFFKSSVKSADEEAALDFNSQRQAIVCFVRDALEDAVDKQKAAADKRCRRSSSSSSQSLKWLPASRHALQRRTNAHHEYSSAWMSFESVDLPHSARVRCQKPIIASKSSGATALDKSCSRAISRGGRRSGLSPHTLHIAYIVRNHGFIACVGRICNARRRALLSDWLTFGTQFNSSHSRAIF